MTASRFAVSLDCSNALELATFWSAVLDRPVDEGTTEDFAAIGMTGSPVGQTEWMFHKVPEPRTVKNRVHLDLRCDSFEAEVLEFRTETSTQNRSWYMLIVTAVSRSPVTSQDDDRYPSGRTARLGGGVGLCCSANRATAVPVMIASAK
jgi:Glyoxalase-like domain